VNPRTRLAFPDVLSPEEMELRMKEWELSGCTISRFVDNFDRCIRVRIEGLGVARYRHEGVLWRRTRKPNEQER